MAKLFGKYNVKFWVDKGSSDMAQPRIPPPPAPDDLFDMVVEAIRKHAIISVEEMERTGDFNSGWKHPIDELLYTGAFSDDQARALQEVYTEISHNVAVVQTRIMATRILCNATEQLKGVGVISGSILSSTLSSNIVASRTTTAHIDASGKVIWK